MKLPFRNKNTDSEKENTEQSERQKNAFFERLAGFFSADPQKEKILRYEDFQNATDPYYATVSARYKVAQRILALILVLFLLISIFTNIKEITYGNLFYFVRDFGNAVDIASIDYETLSYDVYPNQSFAMYRGGVAAVSPSNISVFTATGRRTLKSRSDFVVPYAVCSDKYVLVYDMSGDSFALYNSFSKVHTEELSAPITDAYISDSGVFAVVTSSAGYKSVINVYNKNFKLIGKYSKDLYAIDVCIDAGGERMAAIFYDVGDGRGKSLLRIYDISNRVSKDKDPDEDRIIYEHIFEYQFPLACSFLENGKLSVITDHTSAIFESNKVDYEIYDSYEYGGEISAVYAGAYGSAIAIKDSTLSDVNKVVALDADGKLLYDDIIRESVREIAVLGKYIFVKTDTGVVRLHTGNGEEEKYAAQSGRMLVYDESTVIICGESKAIYVKFKD